MGLSKLNLVEPAQEPHDMQHDLEPRNAPGLSKGKDQQAGRCLELEGDWLGRRVDKHCSKSREGRRGIQFQASSRWWSEWSSLSLFFCQGDSSSFIC